MVSPVVGVLPYPSAAQAASDVRPRDTPRVEGGCTTASTARLERMSEILLETRTVIHGQLSLSRRLNNDFRPPNGE
jgi:hypothetical protein